MYPNLPIINISTAPGEGFYPLKMGRDTIFSITVLGEGFHPLKLGRDTIFIVPGEGFYPLKMGRGIIQLNHH